MIHTSGEISKTALAMILSTATLSENLEGYGGLV